MYATTQEITSATIIPFPSKTKELISLYDLSDVNICYLASLGKYGKPASISVNYKSNNFVLYNNARIIGVVSKKYYYLAKEVLESEYRYCNNVIKRLSPMSNLKGNVKDVSLTNLIFFMRGAERIELPERNAASV